MDSLGNLSCFIKGLSWNICNTNKVILVFTSYKSVKISQQKDTWAMTLKWTFL